MTQSLSPTLYNIPAGSPFARDLARGLMARPASFIRQGNDRAEDHEDKSGMDDPLTLGRMQVLLPTRRSGRILREAFLNLNDGQPMLLPRIFPLGDIDEDELSLSLIGARQELALKPAISPLQRKFQLARLVTGMGAHVESFEQALNLADALGRLMDQVYTENLDLQALPTLVDSALFSKHWQISIKFLEILSEHWPAILAEKGVMDAADRRNRLILALADHWQAHPPQEPVIAAGSTGSIPATAQLLKVIAGLPQGAVILPGLDLEMDEESWDAIEESHPQATLKKLLKTIGVNRTDIHPWPQSAVTPHQGKMIGLAREMMRPSATTPSWQNLRKDPVCAPKDITIRRYDCATPQEEAMVVALAMRGALEEKGKTAALVTPDRTLAKRVAAICERWGIDIDDTAGQPLTETMTGQYLRLCLIAAIEGIRPVSLLPFLKHGLCQPFEGKGENTSWRGQVRRLEKNLMRGFFPGQGWGAYYAALEKRQQGVKTLPPEEETRLHETLSFLEESFAPLISLLAKNGKAAPHIWRDAHLEVAENFCPPEILWGAEPGEEAARFFSEFAEQASSLPDLNAKDYLALIDHCMARITVRRAYGLHPRLMILGQLEARLIEADLIILSGLNEKTWPGDIGVDPWMSRPMRTQFGLPPAERSIGLAAHDFVQGFCRPRTVLTRAVRVEGTPTVPARWLQRLDTVLGACRIDIQMLFDGPLLQDARRLDETGTVQPYERPKPTPPINVRPRNLPVTDIERWMQDPYGLYAKRILRLKKIDPVDEPLGPRERGSLVHRILDRFVETFPKDLPAHAIDTFLEIANTELAKLGADDDTISLWQPRLEKIGDWVIKTETAHRVSWKPRAGEVEGTMTWEGPAGPFTLRARADRIDESLDGRETAIIDYKSSGGFTGPKMKNGLYPQLPLEALIAETGGFSSVKDNPVTDLSYWIVHGKDGKDTGGEMKAFTGDAVIQPLKDAAREGFQALIEHFDRPGTIYHCIPLPGRIPAYNDYDHLARIKEWTALDEQEGADTP